MQPMQPMSGMQTISLSTTYISSRYRKIEIQQFLGKRDKSRLILCYSYSAWEAPFNLLKHTTTLFSLSYHDILSQEWRVIVDQV